MSDVYRLEPISTVFGPFHREPDDWLARALRDALVASLPDELNVPAGRIIQGEVISE